jgi:hypothetical protein
LALAIRYGSETNVAKLHISGAKRTWLYQNWVVPKIGNNEAKEAKRTGQYRSETNRVR